VKSGVGKLGVAGISNPREKYERSPARNDFNLRLQFLTPILAEFCAGTGTGHHENAVTI
jgi:hypothetical protein